MWFFAAMMFLVAWAFSDTNGVLWMIPACVSFSFSINEYQEGK
jgi:hypothetical protein